MESMFAMGTYGVITIDNTTVCRDEGTRSASLLKCLSCFDEAQITKWLNYYERTWLHTNATQAYAEDFNILSKLINNTVIVYHNGIVVHKFNNTKNFKGALLAYIRHLAHEYVS